MLKIKSNTNKFTIIFFWEDWKEYRMLKRSHSASQFRVCLPFCSASVQFSAFLFFFSFCFSVFSFFLLLFSAHLFVSVQRLLLFLFSASFLFLFFLPFFSFQFTCCPYFQPKNIFFSPKQFSLQPKTFFSSAHTTISASFCFVSAFVLLVHVLPSESPQMCSALFVHASFSVSCQLLRPKKLFL